MFMVGVASMLMVVVASLFIQHVIQHVETLFWQVVLGPFASAISKKEKKTQ